MLYGSQSDGPFYVQHMMVLHIILRAFVANAAMPVQFGEWVKEHGLDTGLASAHSVRADAMWLAEQYDIVRTSYNGKSHNPQEIRKQCRKAGYDWAGETQHQKDRQAHVL